MYLGICGLSAKGGNYDGSGNLRMICNMGQEDGGHAVEHEPEARHRVRVRAVDQHVDVLRYDRNAQEVASRHHRA